MERLVLTLVAYHGSNGLEVEHNLLVNGQPAPFTVPVVLLLGGPLGQAIESGVRTTTDLRQLALLAGRTQAELTDRALGAALAELARLAAPPAEEEEAPADSGEALDSTVE